MGGGKKADWTRALLTIILCIAVPLSAAFFVSCGGKVTDNRKEEDEEGQFDDDSVADDDTTGDDDSISDDDQTEDDDSSPDDDVSPDDDNEDDDVVDDDTKPDDDQVDDDVSDDDAVDDDLVDDDLADDDLADDDVSDDDAVDDDVVDDDAVDDDAADDDIVDDDVVDDDSSIDDDVTDDDTSIDDDVADDDVIVTDDDTIGDDDTAQNLCSSNVQFLRLPYLQAVTEESIIVRWLTDEPGNSIVEYGPTAALGYAVDIEEAATSHLVKLTGLNTRTLYYYKVRSCTADSETVTFKTAAAWNQPFYFAAYGDSQERAWMHRNVTERIRVSDPDFLIHMGDIVVDGYDPAQYYDQFFEPAFRLLRDAPIYIATGNHEEESPLFYDSFSFAEQQRYYSFEYGNTFFIALNTNLPYDFGSEQYNWFVATLASPEAQGAEWLIVFAHHPPYSESGAPEWDGEPGVREIIVPLMEYYGVDVYMSGHVHDYERGFLNGIQYFITGGGAMWLVPWYRDWPHIAIYEPRNHFLAVHVNGKTMQIDGVDVSGYIFDTVTLQH